MNLPLKVALFAGALALSATPALAGQPEGTPPAHAHGNGHGGPVYTPSEDPTPGPKAGLPAQAQAYGRYCKEAGASKRHVKGEKGTPFSQCVKALAKAANDKDLSPGQACKGMSKKHVKGQKGTPFSQCVKAAAKLRHHQEEATT
jgi:hypothetical protein